jgi:carboxypeptidase family protein
MQIRFGGLWLAAFACAFMLGGSAAAADSAPAIDTLRDIAVRVDAATRETLAAHGAHAAISSATIDATRRAHAELDAVARTAAAHGFAADVLFARKLRQVAKLVANLERAEAAPADATLPALVAASDPRRTMQVALATGRGASCASALTIAPGDAIAASLAGADAPYSTLWLRLKPAAHGYTRLDTTPTALDTEITLFGTACPASDADASTRNDDAYGLSAAVTIDASQGAGVRYARIRNLGRAGRVVASAETAGAILGRVTDARANVPIVAMLETVTPDGYFWNTAYSDGTTGFYLISADPGAYYVFANNAYGAPLPYLPELYPDAPCSPWYFAILDQCDVADATLLTLADGQQIAGIDFALNVGGRIAGVVHDAGTGAPLASASVSVFDANGNGVLLGSGVDAAGRFDIGGLLTGSYNVVATANGFGGQVWDHVACGGAIEDTCDPLAGTPLAVVRDELTSGIDFDLPREAYIHATAVPRNAPGTPLFGWSLAVYDATTGNFVNQYYNYDSTPLETGALAPGSYRAYAQSPSYFSQLWNGIDCPSDCVSQLGSGTLITLARGDEATLSFSLLPLPLVSGRITDASTHVALPNVYVGLVPVGAFTPMVNAFTDSDGNYVVRNAPLGSYYVFASEQTHRPTLYPDAPCTNNDISSCDTGSAIAITVAYGGADAAGTDIAMPPDGSVSGHVAMRVPDGMTLAPAVPDYEAVYVFDQSGNNSAYSTVAEDGSYTVIGVPGGTYRASAAGSGFGQAYPGVDCAFECEPSDGDPIPLAQGQSITGIDFDPVPNDTVFGRVVDGTGAPIAGAAIDLWRTSDGAHCGVGATNADGYYGARDPFRMCGSDAASRLSTDVDPGVYENEVYDGVPCPQGSVWLGLCDLAGGTDVFLPQVPSFVIANFVLGPQPDPIFGSGFDP